MQADDHAIIIVSV